MVWAFHRLRLRFALGVMSPKMEELGRGWNIRPRLAGNLDVREVKYAVIDGPSIGAYPKRGLGPR